MKKLLKRFIIPLIIGIMVMSSSVVFADTTNDGSVVGTANLNGTPENSAKVGDQLIAPEKGWKRYDDNDNRIMYTGTGWKAGPYTEKKYNNYSTMSSTLNDEVKINFVGTKLRLIMAIANNSSNNISITIDGIEYDNVNSYINSYTPAYQSVVFEKIGLENKLHTVILKNKQNDYNINFDAIDIDSAGYLAVLAESISLDKTSLDMKIGETNPLIGKITPDNATNKKVIWKSSDDSIATVDSTGKVTAKKAGTATITATIDGTNLSASCTVNVTDTVTGRAILTITMANGNIKEYDLSMEEVNKFIDWYDGRSNGSNGKAYYTFVKTSNIKPYKKKTEYIIFNKISSFEVDEYEDTNN